MQGAPFRPIASYLIQRTLVLALLCMTGMLAVQSILITQKSRAQFNQAVEEIGRISVPLLTVSLWDIELKTVQQQIDLIAQRPEIGYVGLTASIGKRFEGGNLQLRDEPVSLRMQIPAPREGSSVGELVLVSNQGFLSNRLIADAWTIFLGYGAFAGLVCGLIAYMLRRHLQMPLQRIALFASDLTPQTLTQPMQLQRPARASVDEIDLVADGFSKLQQGLREHIENLDKKVVERTLQLEQLAQANHLLSITDTLTGCLNRRSLDTRLVEELERCKRYERPISVICMDLDHFKRTNDQFGHLGGDQVLRTVADRLRQSVRLNLDWIVRLGGEEFLIVLPETGLDKALLQAERLRKTLQAQPIRFEDQFIAITASFGVTQWRREEDGHGLLARADRLLYEAKAAGRNLVYPPSALPHEPQSGLIHKPVTGKHAGAPLTETQAASAVTLPPLVA